MEQTNGSTHTQDTWEGPFDPTVYATARAILEADRKRVAAEMRTETRRRTRIVGIVAAIWAVCTAVLAIANANLLIVAEIGWTAIVIWAVFYLIPAFMGKAGATDVFDQYDAQLDKLEAQGIALPKPSCIEDLVAAIDLVTPPAN